MSGVSFRAYKKVILVGGGTGGHVTPIVSLVKEHKDTTIQFLWIGGRDSLEEKEAFKENIPFERISTLKLSTVFSPKIILFPFVLLKSIFEARKILLRESPNLVFSKGWPGSLAVGIASWLLRIPLWIHESDTIPGTSNKILGYFAERIFLGFDTAKKFFPEYKCRIVGQILSPELMKPAKDFRYWKTSKSHVLVICGSQGSKNVFDAIIKHCDRLDVEWTVLLGLLNRDSRWGFHDFKNINLYDWIDAHTLGSILANTNLVITRGSATTLAEIDSYHVRKIMIPLPWSAGNHQYHNALWYKENRGDILLEEDDIASIADILTRTLGSEIIQRTMRRENDFLR